jgi:hypothetical protein
MDLTHQFLVFILHLQPLSDAVSCVHKCLVLRVLHYAMDENAHNVSADENDNVGQVLKAEKGKEILEKEAHDCRMFD